MSKKSDYEPEFDLSEDEFVEISGENKVVKLTADLGDADFTPLEAYSALRNGYSFLLESAEKNVSALRHIPSPESAKTGPGRARYSFVGFDPDAVIAVDGREVNVDKLREDGVVGQDTQVLRDGKLEERCDTLDALRAGFPDVDTVNFDEEDRQVFAGGLVGYLAYDSVHEIWINERREESSTPDAEFVLSTRNMVFDHAKDRVSFVFTPVIREDDDPRNFYRQAKKEMRDALETIETEEYTASNFEILEHISGDDGEDREEYENAVEKTREHIYDGDIYQAVLSRKREIEVQGDPRDFYAELRGVNPSPYMYLVEFDGFGVVGSSPETLVSVHDDKVQVNPIAGTCPRGDTAVEDRRLAGEMLSDEKELAEHVMLVDLGRNDVRRVSESGTIDVEDFMSVVQYSHVQHIESTVSGELRDSKDTFDATRSGFPAGTLSGAPKIRAMEIIDKLEPDPRGIYGGGVGYYSWNGDADFAIAIRTATFEDNHRKNKEKTVNGGKLVTVQAGAGIVADSVPESEYNETENKMDALIRTLESLDRKTRETNQEAEE